MPHSGPITERALVYLHPGEDITDKSSRAGKVWQDLLATISKQPGYVGCHWGRRLGDQNMAEHINCTEIFWPLADWDSLASHDALSNDPSILDPIIDDLNPIMRAYPELYHITYIAPKTHAPTHLSALLSPTPAITELSLLVPTPSTSTEALENAVTHFLKEVEGSKGFVCAGWGWVLEGLELGDVAKPGGQEKALNLAMGWESVETLSSFKEDGGSKKWAEVMEGLISESQTDLLELKSQ
ncbi:hypothetical protein MMC12_001150 [Toensbergia leucococca]|nr:hypothetical protein [Toensbergia leucococca]